jgi:uncharacterized membrane protein YphA (DoxX/SURF4 family)
MAGILVYLAALVAIIGFVILLFAWFSGDSAANLPVLKDKQAQYFSAISLFVLAILLLFFSRESLISDWSHKIEGAVRR